MTAMSSRSRESLRRAASVVHTRPGRRLADRADLSWRGRAKSGVPVVVIDTGHCNLDSMLRALELCGGRPRAARDRRDIVSGDRLVLPGVGAFATAMTRLAEWDLITPIRDAADNGTPILGVCLGMQLLANAGAEGGKTEGLGLIPGQVKPLVPATPGERLPHMGWNAVEHDGSHRLLEGIAPGTDFYFVHGHCFVPADEGDIVARTPYCGGFVSVVGRGSVYGVQFHPEKSHKPGFSLLDRFVTGSC